MKIVNCGLATKLKAESLEKLSCGSPGHIAPEVLSGEGYGLQADIYSCGIIMYTLYFFTWYACRLTGYLPFAAPTTDGILQKNKQGELNFSTELWEDISEEALDLVKKMTVRNSYNRPSAKKCLKHNWFVNAHPSTKILKSVIEILISGPEE